VPELRHPPVTRHDQHGNRVSYRAAECTYRSLTVSGLCFWHSLCVVFQEDNNTAVNGLSFGGWFFRVLASGTAPSLRASTPQRGAHSPLFLLGSEGPPITPNLLPLFPTVLAEVPFSLGLRKLAAEHHRSCKPRDLGLTAHAVPVFQERVYLGVERTAGQELLPQDASETPPALVPLGQDRQHQKSDEAPCL
jgi:hypothetical protein